MIKVRVPASSCNLGPGLDCLGIALNMYNEISFEAWNEDKDWTKVYSPNNLIYRSYNMAFEFAKKRPRPVKIISKSGIPSARGLGSSACCIVGGILAANEIGNLNLEKEDMINLAYKIEGYSDNVSPCFLGGMVATCLKDGKVIFSKIPVENDLYFNVLIPDFRLRTEDSRKFLPEMVRMEDAILNLSRLGVFVSSIYQKDYDQLSKVMEDSLHEDLRGEHIENFAKIKKQIKRLECIGAYLSGSGPCIVMVTKHGQYKAVKDIKSFLGTLSNKWIVETLKVENKGAHIIKGTE